MVFDPTKPGYRAQAASGELRDNFVALAQHHRGAFAPGAGSPQMGWIWLDTSDDDNWLLKVYTRHGDGVLSWKTLFTHAERTPFAGSDVEQQQVLYVGKHGLDTNNGKTLGRAKLTIAAGITAAGTPADEAAAVTVKVVDDGEYDEDLTHVSFVNVYAPYATIKGLHTLADSTHIRVRRCINDGAEHIFFKNSGVGFVHIDVDSVYSDAGPSEIIFRHDEGTVFFRCGHLKSDEAQGFMVQAIAPAVAYLTLDIDEWDLGTGTGYTPDGIEVNLSSVVTGRVGYMHGGVNTVGIHLQLAGGGFGFPEAHLNVGRLDAPVAYNVAATAKLRLFVGELSGTETIADGADARVVKARRDGTKAGVPGANDDEDDGYQLFSMVYDSNAGDMYVCCDPSAGAAAWKKITP